MCVKLVWRKGLCSRCFINYPMHEVNSERVGDEP